MINGSNQQRLKSALIFAVATATLLLNDLRLTSFASSRLLAGAWQYEPNSHSYNYEPYYKPKPRKIYHKVLLCEKTLVSLEYVESSKYQHPGPQYSYENDASPSYYETHDSTGDSLLDIKGAHSIAVATIITSDKNAVSRNSTWRKVDGISRISERRPKVASRLESIQEDPSMLEDEDVDADNNEEGADSPPHASTRNHLTQQTRSQDKQIKKNKYHHKQQVADDQLLTSASESFYYEPQRRPSNYPLSHPPSYDNTQYDSYSLSDDDPLVKCDMWDLDKGISSRRPPDEILRLAVKTDFKTIREAINQCRRLSESSLTYSSESGMRDGLEISTEDIFSILAIKRGLLPGTKWCGLGDRASGYNDLGSKQQIDICCRAHDHCPIRLKPFRGDYGIYNMAFYTKSHCDCDADFYKCLREVRSKSADVLGNLYFNVMRLQCIRPERSKICIQNK